MILFGFPFETYKCSLNTSSIASYCLSYKETNNGRFISNVGGWQSENLEGKHLVLNDLFLRIEEVSKEYTFKHGLSSSLQISNIWININPPGSFNSVHNHINGYISGVYYVTVPKNSGNLILTAPDKNERYMAWMEKNGISNNTLKNNFSYTPVENEIVLFPSWLDHNVEVNNSLENRISISFNILSSNS